MKLLPLYPGDNRLPIEKATPLDLDPKCERCSLHEDARTVCMGGDGSDWEPGGILFVAEAPDRDDDRQRRPFVGRAAGGLIKQLVRKVYTGPAAYDYVVRCHPKTWEGATLEQVEACHGYLNSTIQSEQPTRIITFGAKAAAGLLGDKIQINSSRRGYTYLYNQGKAPILVIFLGHPTVAAYNKFKKRELIEDIAWAVSVEAPPPPPWDACTRIVETVEDALDAEEEFAFAPWVTYDTETAGKIFNHDFKIIAMAATAAGCDSPWTWTREALTDPAIRAPLERTLANEEIKLGGQSIKYDMLCARSAWGIEVRNPWHDTRLSCKTINCEADAHLSVTGHLVGMGGHKMEAKNAIASGLRKVQVSMRRLLKGKLGDGVPLLPGLDPDIEASIRGGANPQDYKFAFTSLEILQRYCALDVVTTDRLVAKLEKDIANDSPEIAYAWNTVVRPVNQALEQVEAWGMAVSLDTIKNVSAFCKEKLVDIEKRLAPYDFSPSAPKQVSEVLYGKLGLPVLRKTPTGAPSTDAATLKALRGKHPLVQDILDWRKYSKLDGTYATGLQQHIRADGRIHPNLKPDGTRSGRWSCIAEGTPVAIVRLGVQMEVPIQEVTSDDLAICFDSNLQLIASPVTALLDQGKQHVLEFRWSYQGRKFERVFLTPEHRVRMATGEYRPADTICHGERLLTRSGVARAMTSRHSVRRPRQVYDLVVEDHHNFLVRGLCVHNCTDPNLQNLPSEKELEGQLLRGCFVAPPGKLLIAMDYSQIELRVACMLSGDEEMLKVFMSGEDFHTSTAKLISQMAFGIPPEQVEKKHRRIAKTFNFGLLYGMGDLTLAEALGITELEAAQVRRAILGNFRQMAAYSKECLRDLDRTGYTWTWWQGKKCRRRPLFDAAGRDNKKKSTAENGAFNTRVQGSAGEYNNMSLIAMVDWVKESKIPAKVIMAVHDCIMLEVDEAYLDEAVTGGLKIMTQWDSCGVPLEVDVEVGRDWGNMTNDRSKWPSL